MGLRELVALRRTIRGTRTDIDILGKVQWIPDMARLARVVVPGLPHHVTNRDRGALNGGKTAISGTPGKEEDFTLDGLGNFSGYVQKTTGSTDLSQSRSHNQANEIDTDATHGDGDNAITESTGTAWADPVQDAAGNMTLAPRPASPASSFTLSYDAWNRLMTVVEGESTLAEYEYDGYNRRTIKREYGDGEQSLDYYYNTDWQVLEVHGGDVYPAARYIWGADYIDQPILRDRDADGYWQNGFDERRYYMTDANRNVIGLTDQTGAMTDRYSYSAYGEPTAYGPTWTNPTSPTVDGPLYCGYHFDADTRLYQVRHRYYHAGLGRWISRDPIGYEAEDFNLYRYVFNRPFGLTDPSGLIGLGDPPWGQGPGAPKCCPDDIKKANEGYAKCVDDVMKTYKLLFERLEMLHKAKLKSFADAKIRGLANCEKNHPDNYAARTACQLKVVIGIGALDKAEWMAYGLLVSAASLSEAGELVDCAMQYPCAGK